MFAFRVVLFFLLIPLVSTAKDDVLTKLRGKWISTYQILLNKDLQQLEPLKKPAGTWLSVGTVFLLDSGFHQHQDCILYKTPNKNHSGILKIVRKKTGKQCKDLFFQESEFNFDNIKNFGFSFKGNKLTFIFDQFNFDFEFFNIRNKSKFSLNKTRGDHALNHGVLVGIGESEQGKNLKNGEICFQVNDNCKTIKNDTCFLCPDGAMAIKDNQCSSKYSKVCSSHSCGNRGEYACLRGQMFIGPLKDYCINDSPVGYCKKPFRVLCENRRLVCR